MEYVLWSASPVKNACKLEKVENFPEFWELSQGVPLKARFPKDALMRMSRRFKKNTALTDDLVNGDRSKVCSKRLVEFLKKQKLVNVEYLPITILDHKGKVASKEYSVVHPVGLQDALDYRRSKPKYNELVTEQIDEVDELVIIPAKVDPAVKVFRLKGLYHPVLVEKGLAEAIEAEGFDGPFFEPLEDWGQ